MPTVGSLFSGIGGIDLGLERAGFTTAWQVEWDGYCQRVLAKHWPDVPRYGDITSVDFATLERVDLLAGGFPCQPVSSAGKQRAQADARWLWPEFERAIRDLRPRHVLVENVRNLLRVNDGSAFAEVLGGLASLGYDAEWRCIRASDVGAPHGRDRLWIVAHASGERRDGLADVAAGHDADGHDAGRPQETSRAAGSGEVADTTRDGDGRPRFGTVDGGEGGRGPVGVGADGPQDRLAHADGGRSPGQQERDGAPAGREWPAPLGHDADRRADPRGRHGDAGEGHLADAEGEPVGARLREGEPRGLGRGRSGDIRGENELADAAGGRQPGPGEPVAPCDPATGARAATQPVDGRVAEQRGAEPGMGRGAHGLSGGLDGHRWPAPPGPQYAWEPPRVAVGIVNRRPRLQGLGNAVVPQIVTLLGEEILACPCG